MFRKIGLAFIIGWFAACSLHAQVYLDSVALKPLNQATLLGVGKVYLNDSYLSPLRYEGTTFSLLHDRLSGTRFLHDKMLLQQQFFMQVAVTHNPSASASEYYGNVAYRLQGFYPLGSVMGIRLSAGAGWDAALGGIYNVRNSNNPGSLKVSTNFNLSAMAIYNWRKVTFRWQATTPFAGLFFSPEYGHSYYEIFSLGNSKGTVHFGSFHNQLSLRNYFTVDVPVHNVTLRAAYLGDYYRTDVNEIVTRIVSHQFMIGMAVESLNFGGKKIRRNNAWLKSAYY